MTTPTACPRIFARYFIDRVAWFLVSSEGLVGHGIVSTHEQLRGVQVRAGVLEVLFDGIQLPPNFDGWHRASEQEQEILEDLFAQVVRENSVGGPKALSKI